MDWAERSFDGEIGAGDNEGGRRPRRGRTPTDLASAAAMMTARPGQEGPLAAESRNGAAGFGIDIDPLETDAPADLGAHELPRAGGSADNDDIESGGTRALELELAGLQEPGPGGGNLDGLGTSTAPAGAAAAPQALHLPYGNGATDHELEKVMFGKQSIIVDGPPLPRSPDHAAAAAGYKVCYHPNLRPARALSPDAPRPAAPLPPCPRPSH